MPSTSPELIFSVRFKSRRRMVKEEEKVQCGELLLVDRYNDTGEDDNMPDSVPLYKGVRITIGRNDNNDIILNHAAISGIHCIVWSIQFDENSIPLVYLKDVSLNGTYINDVKLSKNSVCLLNHGDIIAIEYGIEVEYQSVFGYQESEFGENIITNSSVCKEFKNWSISNRILGNGTFGYV